MHTDQWTEWNRKNCTLEFVDAKGRVCTAVRRISLTTGVCQQHIKIHFVPKQVTKASAQSEEHALAIGHADGTIHTLSNKVCDFKKAILLHLGVPKAIFKYVVFYD
uniref:DDE Tnp4 domain-containing protein n=1 Tax=Caenorhabditis tropicalis TaxID=1561998 RepID=A0A1I7TE06_9PELO